MAAWSVVLGFGAIFLVFRTTDWRGLIKQAQEDADREDGDGGSGEAPGGGGETGADPSEATTPSSA